MSKLPTLGGVKSAEELDTELFPLKPSELLRKGAEILGPENQVRNTWAVGEAFSHHIDLVCTGACAMGAMAVGALGPGANVGNVWAMAKLMYDGLHYPGDGSRLGVPNANDLGFSYEEIAQMLDERGV